MNSLGVGFLDCPVSGGVEGARTAIAGHHSAAADEPVFNRARPILEAMGKAIAYIGSSGRGTGDQGDQPDHVCRDHTGGG